MIAGTLNLAPKEVKTSKRGTEYTTFSIKNEALEICKVLCFSNLALKVCSQLKEKDHGTRVYIVGKYDGEDSGVKIIKAKDVFLDKPSDETLKQKEIQRKTLANSKKIREAKKKAGLVYVKREEDKAHYVKKELCVKANGIWQESMEFIMDVLTPGKTIEILKSEGITDPTKPSKNFNQVHDQLLNLAMGDYNGNVEEFWYRSEREQVRSKEDRDRRDKVRQPKGSKEVPRTSSDGESRKDKNLNARSSFTCIVKMEKSLDL